MEHLSSKNETVLRLFIIAAACIGAALTTIFSPPTVSSRFTPFIYILPIILVVYFYPKRAVLFTLAISLMYISIVYLLGYSNSTVIVISTAWFAIFIAIAVVSSAYTNRLVEERTRIANVLDNSQDDIFCLDLHTRRIREINVKCAQWLRYDRTDLIDKDLSRILVDSENRNTFISGIRNHPTSGENELFFHTHEGAVRQFLVSASRADNDIVICSAIDITERKLAESVIAKAKGDLELWVRERTDELLRPMMNSRPRSMSANVSSP